MRLLYIFSTVALNVLYGCISKLFLLVLLACLSGQLAANLLEMSTRKAYLFVQSQCNLYDMH